MTHRDLPGVVVTTVLDRRTRTRYDPADAARRRRRRRRADHPGLDVTPLSSPSPASTGARSPAASPLPRPSPASHRQVDHVVVQRWGFDPGFPMRILVYLSGGLFLEAAMDGTIVAVHSAATDARGLPTCSDPSKDERSSGRIHVTVRFAHSCTPTAEGTHTPTGAPVSDTVEGRCRRRGARRHHRPPDVRNAVDRTTAEALAAAFRAFDADDGARGGGAHRRRRHLLRGRRSQGDRHRQRATASRPRRRRAAGPDAHAARQAGDRRRRGPRRRRRARAGAVVRPARRRARRRRSASSAVAGACR